MFLLMLAGAGLGLGILCGRSFQEEKPAGEAGEMPAKTGKRMHEAMSSGNGAVTAPVPEGVPEEGFVVPAEAMRRIHVQLMSGTALNKNECRVLGMTEAQIKELELMIDDAVKRWREREMAGARRIPSGKGEVLWHIPASDPALAEQEWQGFTKRLAEIGGPELEPILSYRLTDGYSPSRHSNAGTGMLNMLTAGFGTLERFIRIPADGSHAQVIDVFPHHLRDAPIDESIFDQFGRKLNIDWRGFIPPDEQADRFSHLPPAK